MSGPTTVLVTPALLPVLLAASAICAARAVQQGHADAAALRGAHAQERQANRQRQAGAHEQGLAALQAQAKHALQDKVQRAQALVIEQSLQDLGYQVEEIQDTLFVEGGVTHFRKSHWGDYLAGC